MISSKSKSESDLIREEIAGSIRSSFTTLNVLPKEIEIAKGSTVVAIKINWSKDRTDEHNKNEILKIIDFYRFLDEKLNEWNNGDSINLLNNNLEDKSVNANLKQRNGLIFESRLVESVPVSYKYFTVDHLIPNIMTKKITRPASLVRQGDLTLYATSLKVSDLLIHNFYSIERLDPENANEKGYQRLLNKGRAKKLTDYIVAGQETRDAFLPTSIFMATHKNISFNPANNTIDIDIDEVGPFNIVDGQHRVEGLKMAAEKDKRVLEFEVPVNIAINLSEIEQTA